MTTNKNLLMKLLIGFVAVLIGGMLILASCTSHSSNNQKQSSATFVKDNASNDTPVETLKTLTAEISTVEQQNQQIVAQDKTLTEQDKSTLTQFKKDVMTEVDEQLSQAKTQLQTQQQNNAITNNAVLDENKNNNPATPEQNGFVWINDLQQTAQVNTDDKNASSDSSTKELAQLLNPGLNSNKHNKNNNEDTNHADLLIAPTLQKTKPQAIPYYTIPVNSTLTGAIAMQPLIGRVPIDGKVPDPYTFKAIIGAKNLAANGVDIPSDIQGIVVAGVAEGDMLGECVRGNITAMTFVFQDGRISTAQAKDSGFLGTIAAANGNPCIAGSFHTDAALFLGASAALAGFQGYGNALSQSQLSNTTSSTTGATISSLIGSANKYALGQGFSASAQAAQQWWNQRVQNSFDFVYVPNIDLKTGKKLELNINITQEIPIDYDPNGRKVFYAHQTNQYTSEKLD